MLNFTAVTLRRGARVLFADASFGLFRGEKVGITGENGSGKSSLLSLVRGLLTRMPVASSCLRDSRSSLMSPRNWRPPSRRRSNSSSMAMRPCARWSRRSRRRTNTMTASGLGEFTNVRAAGGYAARSRAASLMHGLGFAAGEVRRRPVAAFSGGWRMRLKLARALMCRSDLLLLDEPTNHLDLDAVIWLEQWLRDYPGTLLAISHDRDFLDGTVGHILEIERRRAKLPTGELLGVRGTARRSARAAAGGLFKNSSSRLRICTPSSSASAPRRPRRARRKAG